MRRKNPFIKSLRGNEHPNRFFPTWARSKIPKMRHQQTCPPTRFSGMAVSGRMVLILFAVLVGFSVAEAYCALGYHGRRCEQECSEKCISLECDPATGVCVGGCQMGYTGDTCLEACPSGFYGNNCTLACMSTCPNQTCDHETGHCLEDCPPGYRGVWCAQGCKYGFYGNNCSSACPSTCPKRKCNRVTGHCVFKCPAGLHGDTCNETCDSGFYGNNCSTACPATCTDRKCHHKTGNCLGTCPPGFRGLKCGRDCFAGKYGQGCKKRCPPNCAGKVCHPQEGYCTKGCKNKFWGSKCELAEADKLKNTTEETKNVFYKNLSAESRSVLLYMLMSEYDKTLERAQAEIQSGIRLRNELSTLIGGKRE